MKRFSFYGDEVGSKGDSRYLLWIFFPIVPIYLGLRYPQTIRTQFSIRFVIPHISILYRIQVYTVLH
jgi:hypothetical protein